MCASEHYDDSPCGFVRAISMVVRAMSKRISIKDRDPEVMIDRLGRLFELVELLDEDQFEPDWEVIGMDEASVDAFASDVERRCKEALEPKEFGGVVSIGGYGSR